MILIPACLFDLMQCERVAGVFSHFDDMVIRSRVLPVRIYFTYSVVLLAGLLGELVARRLSALFKGHISFAFAFLILFSPRRRPLGLQSPPPPPLPAPPRLISFLEGLNISPQLMCFQLLHLLYFMPFSFSLTGFVWLISSCTTPVKPFCYPPVWSFHGPDYKNTVHASYLTVLIHWQIFLSLPICLRSFHCAGESECKR